MRPDGLLTLTEAGLYCPAGDFHVDPWRPVERAIVTHAHADHARRGSARYLAAREGVGVLRARMEEGASIRPVDLGEVVEVNGVRISLHPAGHILGSAQVRIEHRGEVWVVSGDYKTEPDPTCAPFEPVPCHTFITESTFGLPIYRWPAQTEVFEEVNRWWRENAAAGRASLLLGYALGKAQRLLAGLDPDIGPIFAHGAVQRLTEAYREAGVALPETTYVGDVDRTQEWGGAMIIAPPSAFGSTWIRRFGELSAGFASGWMRIRGARRRRGVERGFVLSDHADWAGLNRAIRETGAERVLVTHGPTTAMVRWLRDQGYEAEAVPTRFEGERDDRDVDLEEEGG